MSEHPRAGPPTGQSRASGGAHTPPHEPPPPPPSPYRTHDDGPSAALQARCQALCDQAESLAGRLATQLNADDLAALNDVVTQLKAMAAEGTPAAAA